MDNWPLALGIWPLNKQHEFADISGNLNIATAYGLSYAAGVNGETIL